MNSSPLASGDAKIKEARQLEPSPAAAADHDRESRLSGNVISSGPRIRPLAPRKFSAEVLPPPSAPSHAPCRNVAWR